MRVTDLIMESNTFEIGKGLNKDMRELAAKYDVTWGEMVGFVKDGCWYGGALSPKGGNTADRKHLMTFDSRCRVFLKALGKLLISYMEDGRKISVYPNSSSNGGKVKVSMTPDEVMDTLATVEMKDFGDNVYRAWCRWYVSFGEESADIGLPFRVDLQVYSDRLRGLWGTIYANVTPATHKAMKKMMARIEEDPVANSKLCGEMFYMWHVAGGDATPKPGMGGYGKDLDEYIDICNRPQTKQTSNGPRWMERGVAKVKGTVLPKTALQVPNIQLGDLIEKYYRRLA
jgi:hypothetical protein